MDRMLQRSDQSSGTPENIDLSGGGRLASLGDNDHTRLRLLTEPVSLIPPRLVELPDKHDPFNLLEQRDTYEVLAGHIFTECEGIFRQLVAHNSAVGAQYRKVRKERGPERAIDLPDIELGRLYNYGVSRTENDESTHYLFHRTDLGYELNGFRVIKYGDGHVVLKNLEPQEADTDDTEYYMLLHSAQKWVHDYSVGLNIDPNNLRDYARTNIEPPGLKKRAAKAGSLVVRSASYKAIRATSVRQRGNLDNPLSKNNLSLRGRRPRIAALIAAAAILPVSTHEVAGEGALNLAGGVFSSVFGDSGAQRTQRLDELHLNLPADSAIAIGSGAQEVKFVGNLSLKISKNAPRISGGTLEPGQIRRIDPSYKTDDGYGFPGLDYISCHEVHVEIPDASALRVVDGDPAVAGELTAQVSNSGINICNTRFREIHKSSLQAIYVQSVK